VRYEGEGDLPGLCSGAMGVSPLEGSIAVVSWSLQKAIAAERWDLVPRFTTIIERLTERLVESSS
jgi:hypothetical protein